MDLAQVNEALNLYVRPQTFPLAVRLLESEQELPDRARRPVKDLGGAMPACQVWGTARRYGWTMAMGREDQLCPYGVAPTSRRRLLQPPSPPLTQRLPFARRSESGARTKVTRRGERAQ